VVEILSPSSRRLDTGPKREVYARCGSRELWLIDPDKRELGIYLLRKDAECPAQIVTESESFTSALLPGLEIPLGEILAR